MSTDLRAPASRVMNYSRLRTSLFVAACFEVTEEFPEGNLVDVLAANSVIALSDLIARIEAMHGKFGRVKFKRDMPHYFGVAHLRLAGEL